VSSVRTNERTTENRIAVLPVGMDGGVPVAPDARLAILVMSEAGVFTYPLPERGELTIGRANRCGISVDDPQLSREHALLRVGASLEIVDLGSSNGTRVGDRTLAPHAAESLSVGEVLALGTTVMVVQPATANARARHLWAHGHFEARVED